MARSRSARSLVLAVGAVALLGAACTDQSAGAKPAKQAQPGRTAAARAAASSSDTRTVTVDATGKARGVPDQLTARLAVHTGGVSAAGVLSDANLRTRAVLDQAKAQGIDAKDVQTTQVNLGPTFDKKRNVTGWAADQELQITFRKLSIAGRQLDALTRTPGDAARLGSISLGFNDDDKLLTAARTDAVRRARAQAEEMVGALGSSLGRVRTITETQSPGPYPTAARTAAFDAQAASVPIAPGSQRLTVAVRVVFEIA